MRNKAMIDKVINLKGSYEIRIPFMSAVIGWGNCIFPTGHILIFKTENEYIVNLYNTNEEKRAYSPHGEYTYTIKKDGIGLTYPDGDRLHFKDEYTITSPFGWSDEMKSIVSQLLTVLQA